jgi:L-aminopeptidase/D-esterase-like protein
MSPEKNNSNVFIPGIRIGQAQDLQALTGCTVILTENGAVGGVDQRGGAPGTRETDALRPMHLVEKVHAIVLAGGSAFGLDAASGVMRYLEEHGIGVNTGKVRVPVVPAAILYDLAIGDPKIRPDAAMGYQACLNASAQPPEEGNWGAGTGATVGKILGTTCAVKSGIGIASLEVGNGIVVGAVVAVNSFGDVLDPSTGKIIAGTRPLKKGPVHLGGEGPFVDTLELMKTATGRTIFHLASLSNTVIGVVATNARLDKDGANKMAQMAQDGLARAIRPAHTMFDGDTIFALATGNQKIDVNIAGAYAAEVFSQAVVRAVRAATGAGGLPAARDLS